MIRRTVDSKPVRPLTVLARTKPGPPGEPSGSFTCTPAEVDQIARDAWDPIHDGNGGDHTSIVSNFVKHYAAHIFTALEFDLDRISGNKLKVGKQLVDILYPECPRYNPT